MKLQIIAWAGGFDKSPFKNAKEAGYDFSSKKIEFEIQDKKVVLEHAQKLYDCGLNIMWLQHVDDIFCLFVDDRGFQQR